MVVIWTGTEISEAPWPPHAAREAHAPILTWAQAKPLDYPRELEFVIDLDKRLRRGGSQHRLRFYGIDSDADRAAMVSHLEPTTELELLPTVDYPSFIASLRDVAVGLCPLITQSPFSRGKSFGKILGYLDAGVPVVASDAADHALFFDDDSGIVTNDPERWEIGVRTLLSDPSARDRMADRAGKILRERLSLQAAGRLTDKFLRDLLS